MGAARVVAEHAAEGAVPVRRGGRAEVQALLLRLVAQPVQHAAGPHPADLAPGIDPEYLVDVLAEVDDDGDVTALPRQAGAAAAAEDRRAEAPRRLDRRDDVVHVARHDDAYGRLAVVGAVG